jgi:hypothetical protein
MPPILRGVNREQNRERGDFVGSYTLFRKVLADRQGNNCTGRSRPGLSDVAEQER